MKRQTLRDSGNISPPLHAELKGSLIQTGNLVFLFKTDTNNQFTRLFGLVMLWSIVDTFV